MGATASRLMGNDLGVEWPAVEGRVEEGCRFLDAVRTVAEIPVPLPEAGPKAARHIRARAVQVARDVR